MKLALMQPYFFPYVGYFQLIKAVDLFVVYDDVQFIKNGWINRNRILLNGAPAWITLPVERGSLHDNINQRHFVNYQQGCAKIAGQLDAAYRRAPNYGEAMPFIKSMLVLEGTNVAEILKQQLELTARHLGITTQFLLSSELAKDDSGLFSQDRVIEICRAAKADVYCNSIGGMALYSTPAFAKAGITLRFVKSKDVAYKQFEHTFVPSLSIIDLLMFNSTEQIQMLLSAFELISGGDAN
jgi:hypothetical protein